MVYNKFIKCRVCNSITRVRLQIGFLEQHPIVITCGNCGVSLSGKVDIDQLKFGLKFEFENADILDNDENPDYIIECSGEFPTNKQYVKEQPIEKNLTPFLKNRSRMSESGYEKFFKSIQILIRTASRWNNYKRIIDLAQNGNREYLLQEIRKVFPENIMPCRNELEIMRAVHMVEVNGFLSPLRGDFLEDLSFSNDILKLDYQELTKLINYLNTHDGYKLCELQALIYKILDEFIKIYQFLIPAFSIQFYEKATIDYDAEGTSTSNFSSIKQFYLDAYEILGNLMILPIALNNIKYRNNFNLLRPNDEKIQNLDGFIATKKGIRYHFCDSSEIYLGKLKLQVNSKLRNAIGHNDVEYNAIKQQITYIANPKDRSKQQTKYLLEFENEAIQLIQAIIVISEYLYQLRKMELINKGNIPINPYGATKTPRKIGRNDKCPCGSGKKYKNCCLGKIGRDSKQKRI
ncbi:MAG: SEC-C metal-binding domain-containing protein [Eubacteriales bacterium]